MQKKLQKRDKSAPDEIEQMETIAEEESPILNSIRSKAQEAAAECG